MAKKKLKKNITGLRNQSKSSSHVEVVLDDSTKAAETPSTCPVIHADLDEQSDNDKGWEAHIHLDSNKLCWKPDDEDEVSEEEDSDCEKGDVEDEVIEAGEDDFRTEALHVKLMVLAIEIGDDPRDEDWIPDSLRRKHIARLAQGMLK